MKNLGLEIPSIKGTVTSDISEFEKIDLSNIVGFNVTIPYKEDIITFIDKVSDDALKIGAVNTIKISKNKLIGFNTDHIGFSKSLNGKKFKKALVLGQVALKAIKYSLNNLEFSSILFQEKSTWFNWL